VRVAVDSACSGRSGVVGHDDENDGVLSTIDFARIKGGKVFDVGVPWFREMLGEIGQLQ
jgi:pyrophosphate--fructose-6-phosphate 1-phosphotransferase